jgi:hypothetical protein
LTAELPRLEAEVEYLKVNKVLVNNVLHDSHSLHERWPKMTMPEKRQNIEALIEKVVIGDGAIHVSYSTQPASIEQCKSLQGFGPGRGVGIRVQSNPGLSSCHR